MENIPYNNNNNNNNTTTKRIEQQKKTITKKKTVKRIERFLKRNLLTKQINIKVAPKKKKTKYI